MSDHKPNDELRASTERAEKSNKSALRALVFPVKKQIADRTMASKELPEDPFEQLISDGQVLIPPFDLLTLTMLNEQSSELGPCIDAMVANIDGFGHRFLSRIKKDSEKPDEELDKTVQTEKVRLENFFAYACLSDSFRSFRKRLRKDLESCGNAWFEVIRGPSGDIQGFNHLPCYQMRLGVAEAVATLVDMPVLEMQQDNSIEVKTIKAWRRFRRHCQSRISCFKNVQVSSGFETRWFKDFGDPRTFDNTSGREVKDAELAKMSESSKASEAIHMKLYCSRSPYGLPRFIGNLLAIFGDRSSEEINYITFKNNNIPSMAMLVSNGQLTSATIGRISEFVESQIQGSDNYSKFLIVEAESAFEGEDSNPVKIDIKPLTKEQHSDELFQQYSKNNQDKIRRAFRLPPILVGRADDYTRACYSEDTQTLTEQGWKYYWEIEEGELIATLNPDSLQLQYREPIGGIHLYDYDGPMMHFENRNTDVLVTPEHWMWIKANLGFEKVRAKDIEANRFSFMSSAFSREPLLQAERFVEIPEMILNDGPNAGTRGKVQIPLSLWVEFVSCFVADGSTTPEFVGGKRRCMYNISLSAKKERKVEVFKRIYSQLKELGFRVFEPATDKNGMVHFILADKVLWKMLRDNCGRKASEKRLPMEFLHYDSDTLSLSLRNLQNTDGTIDSREGRTSWSYSTTSQELADQVQMMAIHLGHRANMVMTKGKGNKSDCYRVLITPDRIEHLVTSEQIEEEWYSGKVYCYEVPGHLFFTRREGKVTVQGNTADTSRRLADEQVFAPERDDFDDMLNRIIFPAMGIKYHKYHSNSPNTTDNSELVSILAGAERTGGMTPRIARMILEDVLSIELPDFPTDFPQDLPFSMTMAEAVKNQAQPTEVGQQVTALKTIEMLTGSDQHFVDRLAAIQKRLDQEWSELSKHEEHE